MQKQKKRNRVLTKNRQLTLRNKKDTHAHKKRLYAIHIGRQESPFNSISISNHKGLYIRILPDKDKEKYGWNKG